MSEEQHTCGTCKYWNNAPPRNMKIEDWDGFGLCEAVKHDNLHGPEADIVKNWQACVVDGSDYFAALKTREMFGCVLWEKRK